MGDTETWTHEEGLRFACARDLLTAMVGARSAMIAEEMQKANPDPEIVARFRAESLAFAKRRNSFHANEKERIESIFNEFSEVAREAYFAQLSISEIDTENVDNC